MPDRDFLDEVVDERTARSPEFPAMVEAAERRRKLLGALADRRREGEQSQTAVAAAMKSSQSSIARLETSATDARMSTLDRYARVLGYRVQYHLIPEAQAQADPPVVVHRRA
jgi:predicted transcriptional regulator